MGFRPSCFFFVASLGQFSDSDFGALFVAIGFSGILGQVLVLQGLLRLGWSDLVILVLATCCAVMQTAGLLLIAAFPSKGLIFANAMWEVGISVGGPAFSSIVVKGRRADVGLMLGIFASVDGLTSFMAPLLFSSLFSLDPRLAFAFGLASHAIAVVLASSLWWSHGAEIVSLDEDVRLDG